jgi:type IV pilus assembly protein PilV
MPGQTCSPRRRQGGFTLIEVLVALLVFSLGVLGVVGMQARAVQFSTQAGDRARAAMLANEIVSQMWAQQTAVLDSDTITRWQARFRDAAAGLPNGAGTVTTTTAADGSVTAKVTVTWQAPSMSGTSSTNQFVTTVAMP